MPRGRGRRRRQDQVRGPELRVRRARSEVEHTQTVFRNVRMRPHVDVEQEAYIERRLRVDEPELVAMRPVDIRVNEPQLAALGEVNEVYDEPLMLPGFNEVDIFISQKLKDKIWNFEYIDLSLMHRFCNKRNCQYRHACLKCGLDHSSLRCRRFMDNEIDTDPSRYNRNDIAPFLNNSANRQNPKGSFNKR
ncbi:unnamed protein product [Mytilus edulis]|uniref:Uncharacterized protein n=1 Tax=Mytilus edulis TaxID=6550 RepID=A0A8S3TMI4_MYTED|nr:unnamed protein product [Mytilus edulis]